MREVYVWAKKKSVTPQLVYKPVSPTSNLQCDNELANKLNVGQRVDLSGIMWKC